MWILWMQGFWVNRCIATILYANRHDFAIILYGNRHDFAYWRLVFLGMKNSSLRFIFRVLHKINTRYYILININTIWLEMKSKSGYKGYNSKLQIFTWFWFLYYSFYCYGDHYEPSLLGWYFSDINSLVCHVPLSASFFGF